MSGTDDGWLRALVPKTDGNPEWYVPAFPQFQSIQLNPVRLQQGINVRMRICLWCNKHKLEMVSWHVRHCRYWRVWCSPLQYAHDPNV